MKLPYFIKTIFRTSGSETIGKGKDYINLSELERTFNFRRKPIYGGDTLSPIRKLKALARKPLVLVKSAFDIYERGRYGYTKFDTFSLDSYLCDWLPAAITEIAFNTHSFPQEDDNPEAETFEAWQETLFRMADGFVAHKKLLGIKFSSDSQREDLIAQREEGLELFVKYFGSLWD